MTINKTPADKVRQARTIEVVKAAVCRRASVTLEELNGPKRIPRIATARHGAIFVIRQLCHAPYTELATAFGKADHMSAVHSCRAAAKLLHENAIFRDAVHEIYNESQQYLSAHEDFSPPASTA